MSARTTADACTELMLHCPALLLQILLLPVVLLFPQLEFYGYFKMSAQSIRNDTLQCGKTNVLQIFFTHTFVKIFYYD